MKKWAFFFLASMALYGSEINFSDGKNSEIVLIPGGQTRIRENFIPERPEKTIVINRLNRGLDRDSIVVESRGIKESFFEGKLKSDGDLLINQEGLYKGEECRLVSLDPFAIENLKSGKVIINPSEEIVFYPLNERIVLTGEGEVSNLRMNYSIEGITWDEESYVYLGDGIVKRVLLIKNNSDKKFRNVSLKQQNFKDGFPGERFNIEPFTELKKDILSKKIEIEKNYIYRESRGSGNPQLSLELHGIEAGTLGKFKVFDKDGFIGEFSGKGRKDSVMVEGLPEWGIELESSELGKNLGTRLKQRKVEYSIKNYKNETVEVRIIYDKLPENWSELRSESEYEIIEKEAVFTLKLPGNSRRDIKFSFVEEKN